MIDYKSVATIIGHKGLRIVLIEGMPSPWGQAAKAILDLKGPSYVAAPRILGQANEEIVAWGGEASAPILACADEKPIHRWLDILYLTGRLAPAPSFLPDGARERALMLGFSHEICGSKGIGWNRRLQGFAPAYAQGKPVEIISRILVKAKSSNPLNTWMLNCLPECSVPGQTIENGSSQQGSKKARI